jgi:WD40 repeat protein/DNA-binding winged helix-turn-helix (wHTH) protein
VSNQRVIDEHALRRIHRFARAFGAPTLHLAYHAAVPVVLNTELLHLLRTNFFLDRQAPLPYTAEADLLFSSLCKELGGGLFEIEPAVRDQLLRGLRDEFGESHICEIATLLWQYTQFYTPWANRPELERAQQLTALNLLDPKKAAQWVEEAEAGRGFGTSGEREWFVAMRKELRRLAEIFSKDEAEERPGAPSPGDEEEGFEPAPGCKLRHKLAGQGAQITRIAWSPDGLTLAVPSKDGRIVLWDAGTGGSLRSIDVADSEGTSAKRRWAVQVAWSPDGQSLAAGLSDGVILTFDTREWKVRFTCRGHSRSANSVAWSPDGKQLASASDDHTVRLWSATGGRNLAVFADHRHMVNMVVWSPDGFKFASCSDDKSILVADAKTRSLHRRLAGHEGEIFSLAWSPDGSMIASGDSLGVIKIWRADTWDETRTLKAHANMVCALSFSADGGLLASKSWDGKVILWSCDTAEVVARIEEPSSADYALSLAFNPNGPTFATLGDSDTAVRLWDLDLHLLAPAAAHLNALNISLARLPVTGPHLFGRERELKALDAAWDDRDIHVLSFVAWGGVGKSALVNHWLAQMARDDYRGAQLVYGWSFYSQGTTDRAVSADQFIEAALVFFGDPDPNRGSPWEKGERLAQLVGRRRALLVLDGLEPLQYPPGPDEGRLKEQSMQALLRGLAAHNEGLCIISTRVRVTDLLDYEGGTVTRIDLENLSPEAGAQVLAAQGARGTQAELEQASREFDGHSLALTLLGSYLADVYGGDIARRAEVHGLEDEEHHGRHAQRVMTSYERWFGEGPELSVLRLLGLFNRPADKGSIDVLRAAPAISGLTDAFQGMSEPDWRRTLAKLRRAGLLAARGETHPDALDAHPLVREHFGRQLRRANPDAWREVHSRLYEHLRDTTKEFPNTLEEMAPLFVAVTYACEAGRYQEALDEIFLPRITRGTQEFSLKNLGAGGSELATLASFFERPWERPAAGLDEPSKAFVLNEAGMLLRSSGRLTEAVQPLQAGRAIRLLQQDWRGGAISEVNLSQLYLTIGDLSQALEYARRGVELADRTGDVWTRVTSKAALAGVMHRSGRMEEAEDIFREAEEMQKGLESPIQFLYSLHGFEYCSLLLSRGKYQEVLTRAVRTLELAKHQGWILDIARDHLSIGRAHMLGALSEAGGDLDAATNYLNAAVGGLRQAGSLNELPQGLLARAELRRAKAEFGLAQADLDEAMSIARRGNMGPYEADCNLEYARLYLAMGEMEEARASWERASELIGRMGYHLWDDEIEVIGRILSTDKTAPGHFYEFGRYRLYPEEGRLVHDGKRVRLPSREFALLHRLVSNHGRTLSYAEISEALWPGGNVDNDHIHRVVSRLRKVLDDTSKELHFIASVRRIGYRFAAAVREHEIRGGQDALDAKDSDSQARAQIDSTIPEDILDRLQSAEPSERAAAVVELSHVDTDEAFQQICSAFDDRSEQVRSAAARALYELRADRAESFTRALREATPERRREIGAAISASGLAGESISQLTGESRERTYEAFSLLFLMAKAGEVQPLVRAIEGHPNNEVRLAVVKLLALSGQEEILPAFRRLAIDGALSTEVRSAVMEAIYQISSKSSGTPPAESPAPPQVPRVDGSPTPRPVDRPRDHSLTLLVDRAQQEAQLASAYRRHTKLMPNRPFVCLVHGPEDEAVEFYMSRLAEYSLPSLSNTPPPLTRISLSLVTDQSEPDTSFLILDGLAERLGQHGALSLTSLAAGLATRGTLVVLEWNIYSMDPAASRSNRLREFITFWDGWPDMAGSSVIINVSLHHPNPKNASFFRRGPVKRANEETRRFLAGFNFSDYKHVGGVVLPELKPVTKEDVLSFIETYIDSDVDKYHATLESYTLFKDNSSVPMRLLVSQLKSILNLKRR